MKIWRYILPDFKIYIKGYLEFIEAFKKNNFFSTLFKSYKKVFNEDKKARKYIVLSLFITFLTDFFYTISELKETISEETFDIISKILIVFFMILYITLKEKDRLKNSYIYIIITKLLIGTFSGSLLFTLFRIFFQISIFFTRT